MTYLIYCGFAITGRIALAIVFGIYTYYFDMFFEILKVMIHGWFLVLALKVKFNVLQDVRTCD